jgi:hypothetical protein
MSPARLYAVDEWLQMMIELYEEEARTLEGTSRAWHEEYAAYLRSLRIGREAALALQSCIWRADNLHTVYHRSPI